MAETVGANERVRQYVGRRETTSARGRKIARTVEKNNKRSPSEAAEKSRGRLKKTTKDRRPNIFKFLIFSWPTLLMKVALLLGLPLLHLIPLRGLLTYASADLLCTGGYQLNLASILRCWVAFVIPSGSSGIH